MKSARWFHRGLWIALLSIAVPISASAAKEEKPVAAGRSLRVAIFPFVNSTEEVGATRIMDDLLRDQMKKIDKSRATFLMPGDVERLLADHDEMGRIDRITSRWSKDGSIDSASVAGLDSLLLVDAVLLVKIGEWQNHRVPVVGAGQSNTTVALNFALFDVRTRARLWMKNPREQRFSPELDASSANVNYDETGVIQRKSDNAPPRYEAVASDLIRDSFKKFPRS